MSGTALEQHHVAPDAVQLPDPLARADDAKAAAAVQGERGLVLGKDPGLERPDPGVLGARHEPLEQRPPDAATLSGRIDVHAQVGDAFVAAAVKATLAAPFLCDAGL
jgi:hypothetical protein